jgi:SAM-dependent methyltransferase
MAALFSSTLFLSASLLFWVQPMIAKMLLPLLGGVPAVWNTCLVFFQAMLLGGYAYAHFVSTRLSIPKQMAAHFGVLAVGALTLPFGVSEKLIGSLSPDAPPFLWLLSALFRVVGLPFFVVASTGPLLQKWFSQTGQARAGDPYFLYSASNLGSLLALLVYPVLLEPHLRLPQQSWLWAIGYATMALCILACGGVAWRARRSRAEKQNAAAGEAGQDLRAPEAPPGEIISRAQRVRWLAVAFVPSSLMLGVTSYLATDIASIPLLWIIPLSIYLLSFILVFARRQIFPMSWLRWLLPAVALGVVFQILSRGTHPVWLVILIHLVFLFLAAMVCHWRLARERPVTLHLTEFYLWISLGGVLGGVFNALLAPNLFRTVVEYPLAIVFACLLRPAPETEKVRPASRALDFGLPILLGVFTAGLALLIPFAELKSVNVRNAVIVGLPAIACFTFVDRPIRFGLGLGGILIGGWFYLGPHGKTLHVERNFFGVARVTLGQAGTLRYLVHGNTLHGEQFVDPGRQCEPLAYYHRSGPLGEVFNCFQKRPASSPVAVVGLGAGATACYARPKEQWTFYEIDPVVIRIARNTNYFSYLQPCAKTEVRVIVGDARLRLREAAPHCYGLIVLDAFSSDAIPVHLLTREALALYLSKLADGGLLVFNISNRYLDLEPVLADLADQAKLISRHWDDWNVNPEESANGKEESHWVIMGRRESDLGYLSKKARWLPLEGRSPPQIWTDDFSNLLGVFKWR